MNMSDTANIAGLAIFDISGVSDFFATNSTLPRFQCQEIATVALASVLTAVFAAADSTSAKTM